MIWPYNPEETFELVKRIAHEQFGPAQISGPSFLAKGSNNAAYVVTTKVRKLVIRVTGEWRQRTTAQEKWCYKQAELLGIPGPEVIAVGKLERLPYVVATFVEGVSGAETGLDRIRIWQTLGNYGALINSTNVGTGPVLDEGAVVFPDPSLQWLGWLDECFYALDDRRLIEAGAFSSEQRAILSNLLSYMKYKQHIFGLSHGDLDPRNVIVGSDGKINLIDWCCSLVGLVPHVDLYNVLREIDSDGPEIRAYLDGYGMAFENYGAILPEVRAYGLIQSLKRLGWSIEERPDLAPNDSEDLRNMIDEHLPTMVALLG